MTDRNERDADLIERVEQTVGMGHAAWDTIDPLEIAAAFREALAAPAASVDVEGLRAIIGDGIGGIRAEALTISNVSDGLAQKCSDRIVDRCDKLSKKLQALIDSAGGAKGAITGGLVDAYMEAAQPDGGDGAVADALTVVNDAANDARHAGDYAKANALVKARVVLYRASTRPSAAAAVPDAMIVPYGSESGEKDYTYGYEKGHADGWNACRDKVLAALAQQEPRHYALADGESASA